MTDIQDNYQPYVDENDDENDYEEAGGTTPESLSLPDEAPRMELTDQMHAMVAKALETERKWFAGLSQSFVKTSPNVSGQVLFATFGVGATVQSMQICREKLERGDTVIVNYGPGAVSIGLHAGIITGGSDTVSIISGASRTIRTSRALWAVATVACTIDVQEEFG